MKKYWKFLLLLPFVAIKSYGQSNAKIPTQQAIDDVHFMIRTIEGVHYNAYFKTPKKRFLKIKDSLLSKWPKDSVTLKEFTLTNFKLTALLSNGHTGFDWQNQQLLPALMEYDFFPFQVKRAGDSFILTDSSRAGVWAEYPVQHINGVPVATIFKEMEQYLGGLEAFKNSYIAQIFPIFLFLNEMVQPPYYIDGSATKEGTLAKSISIEKLQETFSNTATQKDYTYEKVSDDTGVVYYNSCNDAVAFDNFLKKTFQTIANDSIAHLIIDIQSNSGGDSSLNDMLLSYITTKPYRQSSGRYWKVSPQAKAFIQKDKDSLWYGYFGKTFVDNYLNTSNFEVIKETDFALTRPARPTNFFKGDVCLLVGPQTFSSANFLADAVKTYEICPIIGLPTGEYTNDFGEQLSFQMPNSGSYFFVPSTFDIGADADSTKMAPVLPDYVPQEGEDALEFAMNWFKKREK